MFGKFSYLIYMLIFTLVPIIILWLINFKFLKKNLKVVLLTGLIGVIYQLIANPSAENWNAWFFTKEKILDIWIFNFPIENSVFILLVTIAISSAVLTLIHYKEMRKLKYIYKLKNSNKSEKKKR